MFFFFSSRRRHTRYWRDWSSDVCSSDLLKWICRQCGINKKVAIYRAGQNITCEKWEIIGSHVGRKSFVTNLYLAGVSIEDIAMMVRSEEHTSELQSRQYIVCRLLLEKKKF